MAAGRPGGTRQCCLCGREISANLPLGGTCQHAGCPEPICRTCFAVRGRKFCVAHSQTEQPAVEPPPGPPPVVDSEALWAFLREARAAELNFISRFQSNTETRPSIPIPDSEKPLNVRNWAELRSMSDEAPDMKRLLPVPRATSDVRTLCPVNPACRYTIRKPPLILEARGCSDLGALVRDRGEARPLALDALLKTLRDLDAAATRNASTLIAGLFSLTGWDDGCVAHLVGNPTHPALVEPRVSACLIGPAVGLVRSNPTDRRLQPFLPLFRGETLAEETARCKADLLGELLALDRVFLNPFARNRQFTPQAASAAARDLTRERDDVDLVDLPEIGPALKWRK